MYPKLASHSGSQRGVGGREEKRVWCQMYTQALDNHVLHHSKGKYPKDYDLHEFSSKHSIVKIHVF